MIFVPITLDYTDRSRMNRLCRCLPFELNRTVSIGATRRRAPLTWERNERCIHIAFHFAWHRQAITKAGELYQPAKDLAPALITGPQILLRQRHTLTNPMPNDSR